MIVYCIKNMYTTEENTSANKVSLYYTVHDTASCSPQVYLPDVPCALLCIVYFACDRNRHSWVVS